MMLKQKSSPWARLKYLYVLPLAALTVVAFARPEISHELEKIQPEINRAIEEAMKAIDINEKAAKEASKEKSSFSGIVYIDGMESSKERMDNLNPDRIASMNVYKGNEAIAKFGEKGRNGVIEIKLKK